MKVSRVYNKVRTEGSPEFVARVFDLAEFANPWGSSGGGRDGGQWESPQQLVSLEFGLLLGG